MELQRQVSRAKYENIYETASEVTRSCFYYRYQLSISWEQADMQIKQANDETVIHAQKYQLIVHEKRPFVTIKDEQGQIIAELFIPSSIHSTQGLDDTTVLSDWHYDESGSEIVLTQSAKSSIWQEKIYRIRCYETRLTYEIDIKGQGNITEVHYFGGYYSGNVRWGSGYFWSGQNFEQCFTPEPMVEEDFYFSPHAGSSIDLGGIPLPGRGDWFFTPPPFCFGAKIDTQWLAIGVEAQAGTHSFSSFNYRGQSPSGFCLVTTYEGATAIEEVYTLPAIGFDFGDDPYDALKLHVSACYQRLDIAKPISQPDWWREPIFCGWGPQCYLASEGDKPAPAYARQEHYEAFLDILDQQNINPGIIVLDDKWQATYGENIVDTDKWSDLRNFIDGQHARERQVLLWLKAWDPEGLPAEECIRNSAGLPIALDPTNPQFEARFRAIIQEMLSADGYDADGFKIDFTARIPYSPNLQMRESIWGLELMKRYLGIIYDEAKKVKPDALVMTHTPHPYLADVTDMIRLNDINMGRDVLMAMKHRARIAEIACPDLLIDTDNWPITDLATWRDYVAIQGKLGVPSLYTVTHIDTTGEALTDADYDLIRQTWADYRQQVARANTV